MTEAWSITLARGADWRFLGSTPEKEATEVVLRSFDGPVLFATGSSTSRPDGSPLLVPPGEGRRLSGLHFFAKPAVPDLVCRILVRGI